MKYIYFIGLLTISNAMFAADNSGSSSFEQHEDDMVEVAGHLPFNRPTWEFLLRMETKFAQDGGTLKLEILPHSAAGRFEIFIKAPRNRQDLAQFTMQALQNNFSVFQMNLPSPLYNQARQLVIANQSHDLIMAYDRNSQILYLAGFLAHSMNLIEGLQNIVAEDMFTMSDDF
jgi:hypothetical protein